MIAYISFIPFIWKQRNQLRKDPHSLQPEARLYWLLFSTYPPLILDSLPETNSLPQRPLSNRSVCLASRGQVWVPRTSPGLHQ